VPDAIVAPYTRQLTAMCGHCACSRLRRLDRFGEFVMAFAAGALRHVLVAWRDAQRIRIATCREVERMPEAVLGLGQVLRNDSGRRVTVIADRDRCVAGPRPGGEVIAHDVSVRARAGIIGEIGIAASVHEGVGAHAEEQADAHCCHEADQARAHQAALASGLPEGPSVLPGVDSSCDAWAVRPNKTTRAAAVDRTL
jgi:hypothetical protein